MRVAGLALVALSAALAGEAAAQDGPVEASPPASLPSRTIRIPADALPPGVSAIVTVDQDLLFTSSDWGKRTQRVLDAEEARIEAENERLVGQLSAEEAALTQKRGTMDPAEFRKEAEAFDKRATEVRRARAQVVQDLNAWAEADRAAFYRAALPLMGEMMQERGAVAVLDRRTVFVSMDAIDITRDLVTRLNSGLGDGAGEVPMKGAAAE